MWSLAHLTRLTELTLRGEQGELVMRELLNSRAKPVLPSSLVTLRLEKDEIYCFSAEERYVSLLWLQASFASG